MRPENREILDGFVATQKFANAEIDKFIDQINAPLKDDNAIQRVEICVLKYNRPDCEKECVERIIEHTTHPYKLTFFDNRPNSGNMSKVWNKLIREATCEYVLIMDSDAFVQNEEWLQDMVRAFNHPKCCFSFPIIGKSGGPAVQQSELSEYRYEPVKINGHASGFCFLTKRSIVERYGWFDEDYYIFGQDSDMFERVMLAGDELYLCRRALVHHGHLKDRKMTDVDDIWEFSNSTRKASEAGEFNWGLDTMYYANALQKKFKNYYPRNTNGS